jgi:methionine sulfoxide reductase heme-binding subunit
VHGQLWWYVARSAGIVSWALLSASMAWGLALSTRAFGKRPKPSWLLDLHRYLGGLAVIFTGVHVFAILADSFVHFSLIDVLVPLSAGWHPVAVAWGIVSMYLLVAVEVTSLARRYLSKQVWKGFHFLSFPLFALATIHGLSAGTDATGKVVVAAAVVVALITGLIAVRLSGPAPSPNRVRV